MESGGGVVAEDGVAAAGLDGGEEAAFDLDVAVAHGVNTPAKGVQVAPADADSDGRSVETALPQLVERQHAPLAGRELRDGEIGLGDGFVRLCLTNPAL